MAVKWYLTVVLIWISLITNDVEHLFMCLLTFCVSSLKKMSFLPSFEFSVYFVCFIEF